jgi:hypothetical protein
MLENRALGDCQAEQAFAQLGQTPEADHLAAVQIGAARFHGNGDHNLQAAGATESRVVEQLIV